MNVTSMLSRVMQLIALAALLSGAVLAALWFLGRPERELQGIWETEGYGLVFDISPFTIRILEVGPTNCAIRHTMPAHRGMAERFAGYGFTVIGAGAGLDISAADVTTSIAATRRETLPPQCTQGMRAGPVELFDIFWHAFDQHYPYFADQGIDWDARRADALAELGDPPDPDPRTLAATMRHALRGITDEQVVLDTPDGTYRPASGMQDTVPAWVAEARAALPEIDTRLDADPAPANIDGSGIRHGRIDGRIAYLGIHHMEAQASLSGTQASEAARIAADLAATYADAEAVIVDLRYNPGGAETVALAYAGLFADTPRVAALKSVATGPSTLSAPQPITLRPAPMRLTGRPIMVLTSALTGGAAELFVLALQGAQDVTVMGAPTAGALSDPLKRDLPNGFAITLPHQVYARRDGSLIGLDPVVPDVAAEEALSAARDALQ